MIRFVATAAALMLFAAQAGAQSTTPAAPATTPAPNTSAPDTSAPATMAPGAAAPGAMTAPSHSGKHHRTQSLQQRFDAANTTHDGHLTKDQATAAKWGYVTSHFSSIDKNHNGFVTVDDIRAFAKARHAGTHHKSTAPTAPAAPANPAPAAPATNG